MSRPTSFFRTLLCPLLAVVTAFIVFVNVEAQTITSADHGYSPGKSYAASEIETVAVESGNMMLNLPLASLPPGRGGLSGGLSLQYNSKLWDLETSDPVYPDIGTRYSLAESPTGGWKYNYLYQIIDPGYGMVLVFPDGGYHPLCVVSSSSTPDCSYPPYGHTGTINYFTIDGTFLRVTMESDGSFNTAGMTWTISMPDGSQVVNKPASGVSQRTVDRNGNYVDVIENATDSSYSNHRTTYIKDQLDRKIVIEYSKATNEDWIRFDGYGGEDLVTVVKWANVDVKKKIKICPAGCGPGTWIYDFNPTLLMVSQIYLPAPVGNLTEFGGLSYQFDYNDDIVSGSSPQRTVGWGEMKQVTTPTNAYSTYTYSSDTTSPTAANPATLHLARLTQKTLNYDETYDGSTSAKTDTWTYAGGLAGSSTQCGYTITAPDGGVTTQCFGKVQGQNSGNLLLKTTRPDGSITDTYYAVNNPLASSGALANTFAKYEFTTVADSSGSPSKTAIKEYSRDKNGNVIEVKEYDWVAYSSVPRDSYGAVTGVPSGLSSYLKRISQTEYYNPTPDSSSTTYNDADSYHLSSSSRLRSLPKAIEVLDSSSTPQSRSEITYDYTSYSYSSNSVGGNVTQTKVWDSYKGGASRSYSNPLTSTNSFTTSASYDSNGNPTSTTDGNVNTTQITYGSVGGYTGLYPTQVVTAYGTSVARTAEVTYDFYTGLALTSKDSDNNATTTTTYDKLGRPLTVTNPEGAVTATTYYDTNRYVVVKSDVATATDGNKVATQFYDQLGRVRLSKTLEDSSTQSATNETDGIKVQTRYATTYSSGTGYTYQLTSNPYRASYSYSETDPTMGWTRSKAIHSGHHAEVETFSGYSLPAPWGSSTSSTGVVQTDADADTKTITDQAGKKRKGISNALGQMTEVIEDPTTLAYSTTYLFDALGNLRKTTQGSQNRYFMYSSLRRLIFAKQSEQDTNSNLSATDPVTSNTAWSVGYVYDNNGGITSTTDAANKSVSATYDALGRITARDYSDSGMPDVTFTYDDTGVTYSKGRLTKVSTSVSETKYAAFDIVGRVTSHQQITAGNTYSTSYTYKLDGSLYEETYPSGRMVKNTYTGNGDLSQLETKPSGGSYATRANNFVYNPAGAVQSLQLGNSKYETTAFNSRLQPTQIGLGTSTSDTSLLKLEYAYNTSGNADNNGNLLEQKITVPTVGGNSGFTATQTYTYDALNRLGSATESISSTQTWKQEYSYDRYGNRSFVTGSGHTTTLGSCPTAECNPTFSSTTNRMTSSGYSYDANGSVTANAKGERFGYDQENHQKEFFTASNSGSTPDATYSYDGEGRRVKKVSATESTVFVYDAGGKLIEERTASGNTLQNSYVYAGARLVSTEAGSAVNYLTMDHLGSQRIVTDGSGAVIDRKDYLPYGEEIATSQRISALGYTTATEPRKDFTGYEKDGESNLQFAEARYMSMTHGRFTSVDPLASSATIRNPQTFNRYTYVLNSPHNLVDPLGLLPVNGTACGQFCANSELYLAGAGGGVFSSALSTGQSWSLNCWCVDVMFTLDPFVLGDAPTFEILGAGKFDEVPLSKFDSPQVSNPKELGPASNVNGSFVVTVLKITLPENMDPSDYSVKRSAFIIEPSVPDADRRGSAENPASSHIQVKGKAIYVYDTPGIPLEGVRRGMTGFTAAFIAGLSEKQSGKIVASYLYAIQFELQGNKIVNSRVGSVSEKVFVEGVRTVTKIPKENGQTCLNCLLK